MNEYCGMFCVMCWTEYVEQMKNVSLDTRGNFKFSDRRVLNSDSPSTKNRGTGSATESM